MQLKVFPKYRPSNNLSFSCL